MAGYNKVVIVGNLTRDPELKPVGAAHVCRISLALNRQYKNKQTGALVQEVCYIDIVVWGPQAENCAQYLRKGSPILVEGRLKFDSWKDVDGKMRSKHSIVAENVVFLGTGQLAETTTMEGLSDEAMMSANLQPSKTNASFKDEQPFDDELPF